MTCLWFVIIPGMVIITPAPLSAQIQTGKTRNSSQSPRFDEDERLASEYYRNKQYDKAAEIYEKLYKKNPSQYYYTFYLYCLLQLERYDEAEKLTKKQVKRYSGRLKYYVDLGYVYIRMGETDKAEKTFDEAIDQLPASQNHIKDLANSFYLRGQFDKAIETYIKGRKLLDGDYNFRFEVANLYKLKGEYNNMIDELLEEAGENPQSLPRVQNRLQNLVFNDLEGSLKDYLWTSLLRKTQKNPDNLEYSEMLLWLSIQQRDFSFALTQAKSLDRRYNDNGGRIFELGKLCLNNNDYKTATDAFSYLVSKGEKNVYYLPGLIGLLKSKYLRITQGFDYNEDDLHNLENEYLEAINLFGKFPETVELMKDLAHIQAFYLEKLSDAIDMLNDAIAIPNAPPQQIADCKLELADIYLFSGEVWEATLLYSQVEKAFKNDPVGHLAKLKNAKLTYYIGEFEWAKAQLDVLKAATSKLIANDAMELSLLIADNMDADSSMKGLGYFAKADLLVYQNKDEQAMQMLDSIYQVNLFHPLFDDILFKKSEIMLNKGNYDVADSLLNQLILNFPNDILADDALFMRGRLQEEKFRNKSLAMDLYQQILLNHPGSLYAVEARKRFRKLRGDVL